MNQIFDHHHNTFPNGGSQGGKQESDTLLKSVKIEMGKPSTNGRPRGTTVAAFKELVFGIFCYWFSNHFFLPAIKDRIGSMGVTVHHYWFFFFFTLLPTSSPTGSTCIVFGYSSI